MLYQRRRPEKVAPKGSKHADKLYRCQVSGVRKVSRKILKPEH